MGNVPGAIIGGALGAMLPHANKIFDAARAKMNLLDNPKLGDVANRFKDLRLTLANLPESIHADLNWLVKGSGVSGGFFEGPNSKTAKIYDALGEYATFLRDKGMVEKGMKTSDVNGDLPLSRINEEMRAIESFVPKDILARFLRRYTALTAETAAIAKKHNGGKSIWSDELGPDGKPLFYSARVILERKSNKGTGGGSGLADRSPGSFKRTKGSERERLGDGIQSLAYHLEEVYRAEILDEFNTTMKERSLNAQIRSGNIPDDIALYSFGKRGAGTIANAVDVENMLNKGEFTDPRTGQLVRLNRYVDKATDPDLIQKAKKEVQPNDPFIRVDPQTGIPTGEEFYAFPREFVEGLQEASESLTKTSSASKVRLLGTAIAHFARRAAISGPSYQGKQALEDPTWAISTLPPGYGPTFIKQLGIVQKEVRSQMAAEHRGEIRSQLMREARLGADIPDRPGLPGGRKPPLVNASPENLMYDVVNNEGALIEPWFKKGPWEKIKTVVGNFDLPAKTLSEFREFVVKEAYYRTLRNKMKLDPALAGARAHEALGNYWSHSKFMEKHGDLSIFLKWVSEATIRMTRNFAQDAETGNPSVRGFFAGPLFKATVAGTVFHMWNQHLLENLQKNSGNKDDIDEMANSAGGGGFFGEAVLIPTMENGRLVPARTKDGNFVAGKINGARDVLDTIVNFGLGLLHGKPGDAILGAARGLASHLSPQLKGGIESITDQNLATGARITPFAHTKMSPERQSELNLDAHKWNPTSWPFRATGINYTDTRRHLVSQLFGGIPRNIEGLVNLAKSPFETNDQNAIDSARQAFGTPFVSFPRHQGKQDRAYSEAPALYSEWYNLVAKRNELGNKNQFSSKINKRIEEIEARVRHLDPTLMTIFTRNRKAGEKAFNLEMKETLPETRARKLERKYGRD